VEEASVVMYDRDGQDWGWGTWLGMGLTMTVLTALVIVAVVLLLRATTGPQQSTGLPRGATGDSPPSSDAQRVLDERLARGGIDEREYRARRDLIRGHP
jgi:putative membrane protein